MANASQTGWQAVVPGNVMVMGEHAVLHGRHALVCAVNSFMRIRLLPRTDPLIRIRSALGEDEATLSHIEARPPFRFIWTAIQQMDPPPQHGFDLEIESDFSHQVGLGSSAAVVIGTVGLLFAQRGLSVDRQTLLARARAIVRSVQQCGSGADLAASLFGGLLLYRSDPVQIEPLAVSHPITLLYSGYKEPTPMVVKKVAALREAQPELVDGIYNLIDQSVLSAAKAAQANAWDSVGALMNIHQGLMDALGVNDRTLSELVYFLRAQPDIRGAKISGSGLGDCVLGLGRIDEKDIPYAAIPVAMTEEGLRIEKI